MKRRIFLALPVSPKIRESLTHYIGSISEPNYKWVNPQNYHVTITFFGEQEESVIPKIVPLLHKTILALPPIELTFNRIASAPPEKIPTMLWAQYHSQQPFSELVTQVEETTAQIMTYPDKREGQTPIPHITLARFKHLSSSLIPQISLDPLKSTSCVLYESEKTESGHTYTILEEFSFAL